MRYSLNHNCEWIAISRAYEMLAQEVGHVMAALAINEQISAKYGSDNSRQLLQEYGRIFPVLSALGIENDAARIHKRINDLNSKLSPILESKKNIVCIGAEAAWLDIITSVYPDKQFHIVPHSINVDHDRLLANYGVNVRIHNSVDLTHLYGTTSVIITFAFDVTDYTFYTYPIVYRVCGRDTKQSFSELIALDILGCPLHFFPNDLVEIDHDEMTRIFSRRSKFVRRTNTWKLATY